MLDFDDTYGPGLAHLSAPTAPTALVVAARTGADVGAVLAAYAESFEVVAVLARASHPALYERGSHPTAVCGTVGAATTVARLLGLGDERAATAQRLALSGAGGLRAALGSDAKAMQVGAAATGVHVARPRPLLGGTRNSQRRGRPLGALSSRAARTAGRQRTSTGAWCSTR